MGGFDSAAQGNPLGPNYAADGAKPMPNPKSKTVLEAGRRKRREITASSGRESTRLVDNPGTRSFVNTFLGSVQ